MENNKSMEVFAKAPIRKAVLQNALPAMAAMLMVPAARLMNAKMRERLPAPSQWELNWLKSERWGC